MDRTSRVSAQVNDATAQRNGAEMMAAMERAGQATQNVKDAFGKLVGGGFIGFLNAYADMADATALELNALTGMVRPGSAASSTSKGGGSGPDSLATRQISATDNLTRAMIKLTDVTERNITGGGERARGAVPPSLSGGALIMAANSGALRTSSY